MKKYKNYLDNYILSNKKEKGITLIALVITIIILLILAGVAIATLTNSGLLDKVKQAEIIHKKEAYFEEINVEIVAEQAERYEKTKEEAFIKSLQKRINTKNWVNSVIICDENLQEQEQDIDNTVIIVTTKEQYEIIIDVDNNNNIATIRKDYFEKIENAQEYTITFNSNGGEGTEISEQKAKSGFSITLKESSCSKPGFIFTGWCENENGNGKIYKVGEKYKITQDVTLYAIWEKESIYITFNSNGGEGNMEVQTALSGESVNLTPNAFTKSGNIFKGWATTNNATDAEYKDGQSVTFNSNQTLYAIWKIPDNYSVITKNGIITGTNLASDVLGVNAYDGNLNTYFSMVRDTYKYLYVDESACGKKIKVTYSMDGNTSDIRFSFMSTKGITETEYIIAAPGKNMANKTRNELYTTLKSVVTSTITIPNNTKWIGFDRWMTGDISKIYNIEISE